MTANNDGGFRENHMYLMPTPELEELLDQAVENDQDDLADAIEHELDAREMEQELPAHDDSLEDRGLYLGSYAS